VGNVFFFAKPTRKFFAPYSCWDNPAPLQPRACFFSDGGKKKVLIVYNMIRGGGRIFMSSVPREFPSTNSFETQASHRCHRLWAWSSQVRATFQDRELGVLSSVRLHNERSSLEFADSDHKI